MNRPHLKNLPKKETTSDLAVVLTGSRHDNHFRVDIDGEAVILSCACFIVLVDLVFARIDSGSGWLQVSRSAIHRLRKSLGGGAGKRLIENGCGEEYRLTIPRPKMSKCVGVTKCFFELQSRDIVDEAQAGILRKSCRACILRETGG
jgi:hypothetical protein